MRKKVNTRLIFVKLFAKIEQFAHYWQYSFSIHAENNENKTFFDVLTQPAFIYSNSTMKTPDQCVESISILIIKKPGGRQQCHSGVFIINFQQFSQIVLVFLGREHRRRKLAWNRFINSTMNKYMNESSIITQQANACFWLNCWWYNIEW